jgi:hypothetical protein
MDFAVPPTAISWSGTVWCRRVVAWRCYALSARRARTWIWIWSAEIHGKSLLIPFSGRNGLRSRTTCQKYRCDK